MRGAAHGASATWRASPDEALDHRRSDDWIELEEQRPELDRLSVVRVDRSHATVRVRLQLVEELHRLEDAERLPGRDDVANLDERRRPRLWSTEEDADHRRFDADRPERDRGLELALVLGDGDSGSGGQGARPGLVRAADRHAHPLVLDLDLADAGFLNDLDELADTLAALGVDVPAEERGLARVAL